MSIMFVFVPYWLWKSQENTVIGLYGVACVFAELVLICVYVSNFECVCMHMCLFVYMCIYQALAPCVHSDVCPSTCVHIHICVCVCKFLLNTCLCEGVCMCLCMCKYTSKVLCVWTCFYAYMRILVRREDTTIKRCNYLSVCL